MQTKQPSSPMATEVVAQDRGTSELTSLKVFRFRNEGNHWVTYTPKTVFSRLGPASKRLLCVLRVPWFAVCGEQVYLHRPFFWSFFSWRRGKGDPIIGLETAHLEHTHTHTQPLLPTVNKLVC